MTVFITFAIILFGLAAAGGLLALKVKQHGRQILPWTREAKAIRAIKREEELQAAVRKVLDSQREDWEDQFGK